MSNLIDHFKTAVKRFGQIGFHYSTKINKMDDKTIQELSAVIQSSNINFLIGSGASTPFLPLLGNIEQLLNSETDSSARELIYKRYFSEVMLPNKKLIINDLSSDPNYKKTNKSYEDLFKTLAEILVRRKNTILSKQINVFTTNIDFLMEKVLEELQIEYNDGFSGRFNPIFNLANFKKSFFQRSLHYEHISEIPVFNIIKIHGSLTLKYDKLNQKINLSQTLEHINEDILSKTGLEFIFEYRKILVVNPEEAKHLESVLNVYYSELLRLFSCELEKENASLFILGFSMEDKHIREITLRAAKSNPTLRIFICCSQKGKDLMEKKMEIDLHQNIQIFIPDNQEEYTLDYLVKTILKKVTIKKLFERNAE